MKEEEKRIERKREKEQKRGMERKKRKSRNVYYPLYVFLFFFLPLLESQLNLLFS